MTAWPWGGYDNYYPYGCTGNGKGQCNRGTRSSAWLEGGKGKGQFPNWLVWEDTLFCAGLEKEEFAEIVPWQSLQGRK